jgi:hypothetical protein
MITAHEAIVATKAATTILEQGERFQETWRKVQRAIRFAASKGRHSAQADVFPFDEAMARALTALGYAVTFGSNLRISWENPSGNFATGERSASENGDKQSRICLLC